MATLSRRKKIILLCAALGIGGFATYKVLNSSYVSQKRRRVASLLGSMLQLVEIFSAGVDSTSLVAGDLRAFLLSDDDQIPRSLRQSLKIARSREFQDALTAISSCVSRGLVNSVVDCVTDDHQSPRRRQLKCIENSETGSSARHQETLPEKLMQKLFSEPGVGFASAVLGAVARSTVLSALEGMEKLTKVNRRSSEWDLRGLAPDDVCGPVDLSEDSSSVFMDMVSSPRGRALIAECVQSFVGTAVSVYLEKTKDINLCEQLVAGVTKPSHRPAVDELLTSVCSGAVETFVRTSHQVLAAPKPDPTPRQQEEQERSEAPVRDVRIVNEEIHGAFNDDVRVKAPGSSAAMESVIVVTSSGGLPNWLEGVSRTLAVPSNRKLLIEVAGTVTSEAIHSFFEVFFGVIGPYLRSNFKLRSKSRSVQTPVIIESRSRANNNIASSSSSNSWRAGTRLMVLPGKELMAKFLVVFTVFLAIVLHLLVDLPAIQQLRIAA